jgi:hypothetical protein
MNVVKQKDERYRLKILYRKYTINIFRFPNKKPGKFSRLQSVLHFCAVLANTCYLKFYIKLPSIPVK